MSLETNMGYVDGLCETAPNTKQTHQSLDKELWMHVSILIFLGWVMVLVLYSLI